MVEKTIGQMRADMESGLTTSQQITRAYLDRIEAYDQGQFGFHARDRRRATRWRRPRPPTTRAPRASTRPLLGIPIAVKNLYDTKDMATTDGSLDLRRLPADEGRVPGGQAARGGRGDHRQGQRWRSTRPSGNYSNDPWGQVWNAFQPSKSAIALQRRLGDRGGREPRRPARSARRPATRSTRRPSGASLVTLRGTDGLQSGSGDHAAVVADRTSAA